MPLTTPIRRRDATPTSYAIMDLAKAYGIPPQYTGKGQKIGIIQMGGGIVIPNVLSFIKSQNVPYSPVITIREVNGGKNQPGQPADDEQYLDICIIGTIACSADIFVYNVQPNIQGYLDFLSASAADGCTFRSVSWGAPEPEFDQEDCETVDSALAASTNIFTQVASGDAGAGDGIKGVNPDFLATSPHVLACGGSTYSPTGDTVWNDSFQGGGSTGGGISNYFARPDWQTGFFTTDEHYNVSALMSRGEPDLCANGDPDTAWRIQVGTQPANVAGTSAVAPFITAYLACVTEARGKPLPWPIHPFLYANEKLFGKITQGNNGFYSANPDGSWCAATGLGYPTAQLFNALVQA